MGASVELVYNTTKGSINWAVELKMMILFSVIYAMLTSTMMRLKVNAGSTIEALVATFVR